MQPSTKYPYPNLSLVLAIQVKPKDHGKAEECFREAISLKQDHVLSLMALGALMWHCNYLDKAEVLFRKAIDQHTEEEFIPWMLLSQVGCNHFL